MRKAGQRLTELFIPNAQKVKTPDSPYFYGMDESTWRNYANDYHAYLKDGGDSQSQMIDNIMDDFRVGEKEARSMLRYSQNNDVLRHVAMGTPHAYSSEKLIQEALIGSGKPAMMSNGENFLATDLEMALGNLRAGVDVQNRFNYGFNRGVPKDTFAALGNLRPGTGRQVFDQAAGNDTMLSIIQEAKRRGGGTYDKLMHSAEYVEPALVKDYLMGGIYDIGDIQNQVPRKNQGTYDVTRPLDIYETDLNKVRQDILGLTKNEFLEDGGEIIRGQDRKLGLVFPRQIVQEISNTPNFINDEVRQFIKQ